MVDQQAIAFVAVAAVLVVTPGADMALVLKNALLHGRRAAVATSLGINLGVLIWTLAAGLGLAALIGASPTALTVIRVAGGAYLVYLGLQLIRRAGRPASGSVESSGERRQMARRTTFQQGVLSNLLNPKLGVFYTSLLPQFISADDPVVAKTLFLGALVNAMGLVWLVSYALLLGRISALLHRAAVRRWLDRAVGTILAALGVRLAVER